MASIENIKGSDGSGNANVATVQTLRSSGASTIIVDTVLGYNAAGFEGTMGTPHTFTDPITSETITVISEATAVDFSGHIDGSNIEIDDIAPGYTDLGSAVGDIVIVRPTTQWSDNVAAVLEEQHNDDGSHGDVVADSINTATPNGINQAALPLGSIVQAVMTTYNAAAAGSTAIPEDDTIPQITEGDEFMTQAITPKAATNILIVEAKVFGAYSVAAQIVAALFRDAGANAIAVGVQYQNTANGMNSIIVTAKVVAGSTAATTFKIRAGGSAGTFTFNGFASGRKYGDVAKSSIKIIEYKA